jgi:phytoene/squalene synthetase
MTTPGFAWTRQDFKAQLKGSSFFLGSLFLDPRARADMAVFYSYCRAIDDCADEFKAPDAKKHLARWQGLLKKKPSPESPLLWQCLWELCMRREIPVNLLQTLLEGAKSDLRPKVRFKGRKELFQYCHQVAGVVGQACLPIFGIPLHEGAPYAEALGRAFQLINILRDVSEDAARGRDYFAQADRRRYASELELYQAYDGLAMEAFREADRLAASLPPQGLRPSRMMRRIYGRLLERMREDGFRVREKRYRLSSLEKFFLVIREFGF